MRYNRKEAKNMQPRPRFPMQGGMGPQMMGPGPNPFGGRGQMMNPFGGRNQMMGPGSNMFGGRNPMMGGPGQMGRGGGGLLSKLLGRGNQAAGVRGVGAMQGAGRAATGSGGGLLQSLSNPGGITSMLNNTQQVLKTAQSIGPMIQQYGPIVKNIPAMWKLYRGLKNAPDSTEETANASAKKTETVAETSVKDGTEKLSSKNKQTEKRKKTAGEEASGIRKGSSVPKLYI